MTVSIPSEILNYDFDVPIDFFPIPLGQEDLDSRRWAQTVVDDVTATAIDPGVPGVLADALVELRVRLLGHRNPSLAAAFSVRPATMSVGSLLTSQQLAMDADDGPEGFEQLLREESHHLRVGARSRDVDVWRARIRAGELVGMSQRVEFVDLAGGLGRLSQRTVFGIFPDGVCDMLLMNFTTEDFGAFANMREETQSIVATLRIETGTA